MAYVWRLETEETGVGVFGCDCAEFVRSSDNTTCNPYDHPGPMDEGISHFFRPYEIGQSPWHFGFKSLKQYRQWFDCANARRAVAKFRVSIVTYKRRAKKKGVTAPFPGERVVLRKYRVTKRGRVTTGRQAIFLKGTAEAVETRRPDYAD